MTLQPVPFEFPNTGGNFFCQCIVVADVLGAKAERHRVFFLVHAHPFSKAAHFIVLSTFFAKPSGYFA
jgi:hypothetical protein